MGGRPEIVWDEGAQNIADSMRLRSRAGSQAWSISSCREVDAIEQLLG
jgi:hypothetical protein